MTEGGVSSESSSSQSSLEVIESVDCTTEMDISPSKTGQNGAGGDVHAKLLNGNTPRWERSPTPTTNEEDFATPWHIAIMVKIAFSVMFFCGYFVDWLRAKGLVKFAVPMATEDKRYKDFAPMDNHFEAIYVNHIYRKSSDVVNRPVCSVPGSVMTLKDRYTDNYGWTHK